MKYFRVIVLIYFCQPSFSVHSQQSSMLSFSTAKKELRKIYRRNPVTFYCSCQIDNSLRTPDLSTCNYKPRKNRKRAQRIEWEHVVPAHAFGKSFNEWRRGHPDCVTQSGKTYKGRKCASKVNIEYRRMESDMHNLFPAIGEVNGDRSNYSMAIIPGEARLYGQCDVEIANRKIEPRSAVRGDIARTYLYMESSYPGRGIVSKKNRKLFEAWSKEDPVDSWECQRARFIQKVQVRPNNIVLSSCRESGL
jgi:deoxyribonuclease I